MYNGQTYRIPCTGGLNTNPNYDLVGPEAMIDVNNVNIDAGGRKPRGGCLRENVTAITGTPRVTGLHHFVLEGGITYFIDESGDQFIDENGDSFASGTDAWIMGTSDGKIYKDFTTELKTGLSNNVKYSFEEYYNKLYICNDGANVPQVWDGTQDYTWDLGTPTKCVAALAGLGAGNVNSGVHSYKITFVTASGESSGSPASNSVTTTAGNGQVALTSIPLGISGTTARKIYRTEADGSSYKLLTTISDNTTTTYADNIADGSLTTAIPTTNKAFCPSDWDDNWPKFMLKHGRGINKRLWAFGVSDYPNRTYASDLATASFSDADVVTIDILGSSTGLTAAVEKGGNLIIGSKDDCFIIDDVSPDIADWGYQKAIWKGGVAHHKLFVATPSDLMAMDEACEIYSVTAAESYGDYKIASITRPPMINRWIDENIDKAQINNFHAIYDPTIRAIKIFMVTKGYNYPNVCLVYFIDYGWTKHTFSTYHVCSTLSRRAEGNWNVYTGTDDGFVLKLEDTSLLDEGAVYTTDHTLAPLHFDNPRSYKRYDRFWLCMKPRGTETMSVLITVDNVAIPAQTVTLTGLEDAIQEYPFDIGVVGQRIKAKVSNTLGEDYYISSIMYDVKELGNFGK